VLHDTPWREEDEMLAGGSAVAALRSRWDMLSAELHSQYVHQQKAAAEDAEDGSDIGDNDADEDDEFEFDDEHERLAQMASDMLDAQDMREESMRNA